MVDGKQTPKACALPDGGRRCTVVLLLLIVALGAFVRLYSHRDESVWWDEFASVVHLDPPKAWQDSPDYERWAQGVVHEGSPNLLAFLKRNRSMDPATMPLYYTFEYFWNRFVSRSVASQRLLTIFIGVLMIPFIYLFGRDLYGKNAGLIAALCLALSPIHRQFAQEIRMYVLMALLALLSTYTFMHVVRNGGRRWWLLHAVANLLLFWTHPFALLVPFVEGAFWVLFHFKDYRRIALWAGMHVLLVLPSAIYISTIQFWSVESTASWMKVPTRVEFVGDLLADDCIGLTYQLRPTPQAWERLVSPSRAQAIVAVSVYRQVGIWLMRLFLACAVWLGICSVHKALRARREGCEEWPWRWFFFLVMWWLAPAVLLYVVSLVWRPCIMARYTVHSSLALYLIIGGAVACIRWRALRIAAVCALGLLYGYEQMLVLEGPQHTDWKSAARYIRVEAKPDDLILVHNEMWKRVFSFNLGPAPNVMSFGTTFDVLAEECAFFAGLNEPSKAVPGETRDVWAVIRTDYFDAGPCLAFEKELSDRGLSFEMEEFGGIQHVLVYCVQRDPASPRKETVTPELVKNAPRELSGLAMKFWRVQEYDIAIAAGRWALEIDPNFSRAYTYIAMSLRAKGENDAALEAFLKAVEIDPSDYLWTHVNIGMLYIDKGEYDSAIASLNNALDQDPDYAWAYTNLGRAYLGKGEYDRAIAKFQRGIELDPNDERGHMGLQEAIDRKDAASAPGAPPEQPIEAELPEKPLDGAGQAVDAQSGTPREHEEPAAAADKNAEDLLSEGNALLDAGDYDGALVAFRSALELNPQNPAYVYAGISRALLGKGDDNGAYMSMRKAFELDPQLRAVLEPLMTAMFESENYEAVWAEVKRLQAQGIRVPPEIIRKIEGDSGQEQ